MAIYRNVQLSFWTDNKVEDEFTPEDKYFYLYLLTNPQTNICGCYEVSYSQMTRQTGYNRETIDRLLKRFDETHEIVKYDKDTKEVLIINWYKYNWSKSEKTLQGVENVAKHIKSESLRNCVFDIINCVKTDTPYKGHICPIQASVTDTVSDTDTDTVISNINKSDSKKETNIDIVKRIIEYLNNRCGTKYRHSSENTKKCINARLNEGYTEEDFYTVIDKKANEWLGTPREEYLRPITLFSPKFESYLNQKINKDTSTGNAYIDNIKNRISEVDSWV
jgi:uncharacterized phage protein (TIGR02220 family)